MKKFSFLFTFALATMLLFVACNKQDAEVNTPENGGKVNLTVSANSNFSKVVFGEKTGSTYPVTWSDENEAVKLVELITDGGTLSSTTYDSEEIYSLTEGNTHANFTFLLDEKSTEGTYDYYVVYPKSAFNSVNTTYKDLYLKIPDVQTPLANSPDPNAIIYYAESKGHAQQQTSLSVNFNHPLVSFGRVTIKNASSAIGDGEVIEAVEFNLTSGGIYYYWERNEVESVASTKKETIIVKTDNLNTTGDFDVWFTCITGKLSAGEDLIVTIVTDEDRYTRTINLTSDIPFNGGKVSHFSVDMSTAINEDFSGNYLIGATDSESRPIYLMTNTLSGNVLPGLNSGISVADYMNYGATAFDAYCVSQYVWVLEKVVGGYTLMNHETGKYVDWSSGNSVALSDDPVVLSVTRGSDDDEFVVKKGDDRSLQYNYNNGNTRFAFYTSTQSELHFVEVPVVKTNLAAPTDVDAQVSGSTITVTWTDVPDGVDYYVVGCTGQTAQNISQGIETASFTDLESGTYSVTIHAVPTNTTAHANSLTTTISDLIVGSVPTYTKVTGALTSGYYVFGAVSGTTVYAINNSVGTSWIKYTSVTATDGVITNPDDEIVWYYDASDGTFLNKDETNYIYCPSDRNIGACGTTSHGHTVTETSTAGNYTIKSATFTSRQLRCNTSSSGYRYYTTTTGLGDICFFKLSE